MPVIIEILPSAEPGLMAAATRVCRADVAAHHMGGRVAVPYRL
jgi:hypothetical protein